MLLCLICNFYIYVVLKALTKAWEEACAATSASKIVIPGGSYKMEAVDLKGPCMAPIEIQFDGTLQAPADPNALDGADEWLKVQHVNFFTLSGKGVFDGQGATAWKQNDCGTNKNCKKRSKVINELYNYIAISINLKLLVALALLLNHSNELSFL